MISNKNLPVKLLGKGELKTKVKVVVEAASQSAVTAVEAAGGKIEVLSAAEVETKTQEEKTPTEEKAKK
jgi:large subunit ribosomal protein L15